MPDVYTYSLKRATFFFFSPELTHSVLYQDMLSSHLAGHIWVDWAANTLARAQLFLVDYKDVLPITVNFKFNH